MKSYFTLIAILFCSVYAKAQQRDLFKKNPMEDFKRKQLLSEKLKQFHFETNNSTVKNRGYEQHNPVVKMPLTGVFLSNNGKGADVYKMLPYNMPCLVPDKTFKSDMPVAGIENAEGFVSPFKMPEKEIERKNK